MEEAAPPRGTRGQILRVALHQFRAQGYDRTSLRMIADQLGMTKAALYYHFPAKDELLAALVQPFRDAMEELFRRQAGGADRVEAFLHDYLDVLFAEYDVVRWCATDPAALYHAELGSWLRSMRDRLHDVLTGGSDDDAARVRAAGAIGAVHAVMFVPREVAMAHRAEFVACAMAAFTLPSGGRAEPHSVTDE